MYHLIDGVDIPDWLFEAVLCEPNKGYIETMNIREWADEHLLPLASKHPLAHEGLSVSSNHVHISSEGLTPHDHLPNAFTSVLYLTDSDGCLALHLPDGLELIKPQAGRYLIFPADVIHHVIKSPNDELRISLVTNYEYPSI